MSYPTGAIVFLLIIVFLWWGIFPLVSSVPRVVTTDNPGTTISPKPVPVQQTFDYWKSAGDALKEQHRNGDALDAYDHALAIRPGASEIWVAEGDLYDIMGNFEKAAACYDRALGINPQVGEQIQKKLRILNNNNDLMIRGEELVDDEKYSSAIAIYDEILSAGIQNSDFQKRVLSAKVYALLKSGKPDEAAQVSKTINSLKYVSQISETLKK
jgi:tetratricopeptide (TPR) repeat protein